jgi:hypothetical protein
MPENQTGAQFERDRLIAAGDIYVELRAAGIMEPDKARVFPTLSD